jgi:uncharacterized membrane protein YjfL (UPF0719 family)
LAFLQLLLLFKKNNVAAGIVAAGAFIGYALIEIQDIKILNKEDIKE